MIKKIEKYGFYAFFVLFFIALYVAVDLNSRLHMVMSELVDLKSEDRITKEQNTIFAKDNVFDIEKEKDEVDTPEPEVEKNISSDNKISNLEDSNIECKESEVSPFVLVPKINFDYLQKRYQNTAKRKKVDLRKLSVKEKKERFIKLVLPAIRESRNKLLTTYNNLLELKGGNLSQSDEEYLDTLYKLYRIKDRNFEKLLLAVKPHPISIILAQAALESGWGTSRFFINGSNIFGMWSFNENDERIRAQNSKNVYLKKYDSYVESVDDYMLMLGRSPRYEDFRRARAKTDDPYELIKHLAIYSELREEYVRRLRIVIKANNFTKFDVEPEKNEKVSNE